MAQIAIVAAIYIVLTITPPLNAMAYYGYQFRVSEMMNFLAFYNKKYLIGVTLGCMIANLFSFGWIDVFVGGGSTFVFLGLGLILFGRFKTSSCLTVLFAWTISCLRFSFPSPCLRLPWNYTTFKANHSSITGWLWDWVNSHPWFLERLWSINFLNGSILQNKKRELWLLFSC